MASGDTLHIFTPLHNEPPTANFATLDTRNSHPVLDYDGAANEDAIFSGVMPQHYAGGGVTVLLHVANDGIVNDHDWDVAFERIGDQGQDIDADGFAAVNSTDNTVVPGTSGLVDVISVTFTDGADMDSVVAGDSFRLLVRRDAVSDTSTVDSQLLRVEIRET